MTYAELIEELMTVFGLTETEAENAAAAYAESLDNR